MSYIPEPITRIDKYLAYIAGNMDVALPDHPITRKEHYLAAWAEKSGFEDVDVAGEPPLTLENGIGKPLKGLTIYGKSTQVMTTGAQLLDLDAIGLKTGGGATIRRLDDGGFLVDGTPGQAYEQYITRVAINFSQGTYFVSGGRYADGCAVVQINILNADGTRTYKNNASFDVLGTEQEIVLIIQSVSEEPINNYKIYPMINSGSTPLPWEPYTGGKPSPSPEYPQEIESVGQDGEIGVEVYGRNLFDKSAAHNFTKSGGWSAGLEGEEIKVLADNTTIGSIALFRCEKTLPAGTYTFSISKPLPFRIRINNYFFIKKGDTSATVTFDNDVSVSHFAADAEPGTTFNEQRFKIMLNTGSTAIPYEPYHEPQFASIATPNGLLGIPVASGGNYTDTDGQQWICDEIDFARGMYVQNIKVDKNLNDLKWMTWGTNKGADGITGFYTYDIDIPKIDKAISNIERYNEDIYGGKRAGISAAIIKPTSLRPYMILSVRNDTISDVSSDTAAIRSFKEMLAKTDAYMMYVLATPIETPLTSDQLNAYKALRTYKGTTIIDNDAGAYMSVKYEKMK